MCFRKKKMRGEAYIFKGVRGGLTEMVTIKERPRHSEGEEEPCGYLKVQSPGRRGVQSLRHPGLFFVNSHKKEGPRAVQLARLELKRRLRGGWGTACAQPFCALYSLLLVLSVTPCWRVIRGTLG